MPSAESLPQIRARFAQLVAADPWAARMPAVINAAPIPGARPVAAPSHEWRVVHDH